MKPKSKLPKHDPPRYYGERNPQPVPRVGTNPAATNPALIPAEWLFSKRQPGANKRSADFARPAAQPPAKRPALDEQREQHLIRSLAAKTRELYNERQHMADIQQENSKLKQYILKQQDNKQLIELRKRIDELESQNMDLKDKLFEFKGNWAWQRHYNLKQHIVPTHEERSGSKGLRMDISTSIITGLPATTPRAEYEDKSPYGRRSIGLRGRLLNKLVQSATCLPFI
jgi:hypothetical protein